PGISGHAPGPSPGAQVFGPGGCVACGGRGLMSVQTFLRQAFAAQPFGQQQAQELMQALIDGHFAPEQVGALLGALATRLPTAAELTGFAQALRAAMLPVRLPAAEVAALDTCGTG